MQPYIQSLNKYIKIFANQPTGYLLIIILLILTGCKTKFKTSETGLQYKFIIENKNNAQPKEGDIISIKLKYIDASGNIIEESDHFRTQLKEASHVGGSIEDGLAMMHKGDSAIFLIKAEDYYTKTKEMYLPDDLNPEEMLQFYIKLIDIKSYEEFKSERQIASISDAREEDKLLNAYLEKANITVAPTNSGLYVVEIKQGTGKKPQPGNKVTVHYLGYFIDGKIFDSSYERQKPFKFGFGVGEVIQGWDEGLSHMQVGGKYKLVIPSYLAYGSKGFGNAIPPNVTLIFEIELIDVE